MEFTFLRRYGLLSVSGEDARDFLHAQLTNDIQNLPAERAALAGWCSAKGRLLASFLVIPLPQGFLLQLANDLAPAVAKRLSMFVLRAKVKIADETDRWSQYGVWGELPELQLPRDLFAVVSDGTRTGIRVAENRALVLTREPLTFQGARDVAESRWTLEEIRAGRPLITRPTQELFIPQMVNLHNLGGVDFRKGCYPGQEIVARTQYRGEVKRRMIHAHAPAGIELQPGSEFQGGTVVDVAPAEDGSELLAVVPV